MDPALSTGLLACQQQSVQSDALQQKDISQVKRKEDIKKVEEKNQSAQPKVRTSTSVPGKSGKLSDIKDGLKFIDCEDQFKNENGICEVPNQPHPKSKDKSKNNQD